MPLVTAGHAEVWSNGTQNFGFIAVGEGTTPFSLSDAALVTEVDRKAVGAVVVNDSQVVVEVFFGNDEGNPTGANEITELAILDAAASGNLWLRHVLAVSSPKTSAKAMIIAITLTTVNS